MKRLCFYYFLILMCCVSCKKTVPPRMEFLLGTVCTVNAFDDGTDQLYDTIFSRLRALDAAFSVNRKDSQVSEINQAAGIHAVIVSDDVFTVVQKATEIARLTDGAFEPTIQPLSVLWGIGTKSARRPEQEEIATARALVDYRDIVLDKAEKSVFLTRKGMALDLGGIAKGYAADELVSILHSARVRRAIIDLGGNVYLFGRKSDETLWRTGIKNPLHPEDEPICILQVPESSVVTSGIYERFFEQDGKRYHHILDAETGFPAASGLLSVSVVRQSSMEADAFATALFVLGKERGIAFAERYGVDALFIDESLELTATDGFSEKYLLLME
ncbi:MAG: FAD:protein FMN transferase [Treponema sp.]|nr:FAD:protein FMN transferase [Treponema sp.]